MLSKKNIKDFILLNLGLFLLSIGIYFFKFPNHFSTGGVSGLTVVLSELIPNISSSSIMFIINILFLILGFIFLNKDFGIKTIYGTIVLSAMTSFFEIFVPLAGPLTNETMLELVFSVMLPAIGSALIFSTGASSGGTDIIAMILRKYSDINIGKALLITDFFITFSCLLVFGLDVFLYSILGLISKSFLVDIILENISTKKIVTIITTEDEKITNFIIKNLHRGVTETDCIGVYTGTKKHSLLTAVSRRQAVELRHFVKTVDEKAFIVITSSSEIIGKGFARGV